MTNLEKAREQLVLVVNRMNLGEQMDFLGILHSMFQDDNRVKGVPLNCKQEDIQKILIDFISEIKPVEIQRVSVLLASRYSDDNELSEILYGSPAFLSCKKCHRVISKEDFEDDGGVLCKGCGDISAYYYSQDCDSCIKHSSIDHKTCPVVEGVIEICKGMRQYASTMEKER